MTIRAADPDVPLETLHLATNGIEVHAVAAGPPDGRLVVLLHGFPEFWWGWHRQIGPLASAGLRVVALDMRGYNLSDKPTGIAAYAHDQAAADVLGVATALGRDRFAVVGHDWGGIVAWHLLACRPERIERAAILNGPHPALLGPHARRFPTQAIRLAYVAAFQIPRVPETLLSAGDFAALTGGMRRSARPGSFTEAHFVRYREAWSRPGAMRAMLNWYRALLRRNPATPATVVTPPVRIIWGDRDDVLECRLAEAALALCTQGEMFHIPDATHWVQHDAPGEVNELLLRFLDVPHV